MPNSHSMPPTITPYARLARKPATMANAAMKKVSTTPVTSFAMITRLRCGSNANVVIAVRWLHSLVTSRMPITGSRSDVRNATDPTKSP